MIAKLIAWCVDNRFLVMILTAILTVIGIWSTYTIPVDAIPDLSDVQVIIYTPWQGRDPQTIEDQVTYPLARKMLSVPGVSDVRGYSFFGFSFVYVIFEDGTDMYWARSRVLEYMNEAQGELPEGATPRLGPDATGLGWVYIYTLEDTKNEHDLGELREARLVVAVHVRTDHHVPAPAPREQPQEVAVSRFDAAERGRPVALHPQIRAGFGWRLVLGSARRERLAGRRSRAGGRIPGGLALRTARPQRHGAEESHAPSAHRGSFARHAARVKPSWRRTECEYPRANGVRVKDPR